MLCNICKDIFSTPRKLSYGTYYSWGHTTKSFETSLLEGCHLCNLVWENKSYSGDKSDEFLSGCIYAFKVLRQDWAERGVGLKWPVPYTSEEWGRGEVSNYLLAVDKDPTDNNLATLLATDSKEVLSDDNPFWLVLDFYSRGPTIILPIDIVRDGYEQLAQLNLEEQKSTGSKENLQLARSWLSNCVENHPQCRPTFEDTTWLPTRLLFLGSLDEPLVRLVSSSKLPNKVSYAALSHRWGSTESHVLTTAMLQTYEEQISIGSVPATLRDAFHATRSIGLQYLWVDCMCIVQDDPDDWSRESVTMSKVYGLSTCTIGAAQVGDGDNGCFVTRNQYQVRPCQIPNPFSKDSKLLFYVRSQYLNDICKREVR